jgi:hypothetical protein
MSIQNSSFNNRIKRAKQDSVSYFTVRILDYWDVWFQKSKTRKHARKVLKAFAMMDYSFLMNCVIEDLSTHFEEMGSSGKLEEWTSIIHETSYIVLIDFGQMILEKLMRIQHDVEELPVVPGKTFVSRISRYTDQERGGLRIRFKDIIRKMYHYMDQKTRDALNDGGFWIDKDDTHLLINLDKYLTLCDACNSEVCSCSQFTSIEGISLGDIVFDLSKLSVSERIDFYFNRVKFLRDWILIKMATKSFTQVLSDNLARFLWNTCDKCKKRVDHLGIWRPSVICIGCGGECPIFQEPIPLAPAQASDPQSLATELTTATISFGEQAVKIAHVLLENGVSQLSELLVLNQSEFDSVVQKLQLNLLQVQKLRVASGRP